MRKTTFQRYLNESSQEDIVEDLLQLYDKFPEVKDHYTMELGTMEDRKKIFDKSKKKLSRMYERYKFRARKSKAKAEISKIAKIAVFDHELADYYLYHAELCISWLRCYSIFPDTWSHFMDSLRRSLNLVLKSMSEEDFRERIYTIVDLSDCGWKTQEEVIDLVDEILGDDYLED